MATLLIREKDVIVIEIILVSFLFDKTKVEDTGTADERERKVEELRYELTQKLRPPWKRIRPGITTRSNISHSIIL